MPSQECSGIAAETFPVNTNLTLYRFLVFQANSIPAGKVGVSLISFSATGQKKTTPTGIF
jgi:hypothetical protein